MIACDDRDPLCPEFNPVESMWSHAKYFDLANFVSAAVDHLNDAAYAPLGDQTLDERL